MPPTQRFDPRNTMKKVKISINGINIIVPEGTHIGDVLIDCPDCEGTVGLECSKCSGTGQLINEEVCVEG